MRAGDTFIRKSAEFAVDPHLWFVLSDPSIDPDHVLIANFTSWSDYKDQACIINAGEHPFVDKKTVVNYSGVRIGTLAELRALVSGAKFKQHSQLSPELLRKIRDAVPRSRMPLGCQQLLTDQGVVSP